MSTATTTLTTNDLHARVGVLPRVTLAQLPTPLEELTHFSRELGGPRVFIKRDDCTGLAFGGNKTRHNEHVLAHALEQGADMLVWGAGVQSNNCRQTAAACAKLGLGCHLVLSRASHADDLQGNLLLDHVLGATVEVVDTPIGPELDELLTRTAQRFRDQGRKVYAWDREVVKPRAAISYALCLAEILDELQTQGLTPQAVYCCSAGSTGAGLVLGKVALGMEGRLRLVAPISWPWDHRLDISEIASQAARLVGLGCLVRPEDVDSTLDYIGAGYGIPTEAGMEALLMVARTEGILLDPVYTAKAMSALIDDSRNGRLSPHEPVVFIHTGGTPALFAYRDELAASMRMPQAKRAGH